MHAMLMPTQVTMFKRCHTVHKHSLFIRETTQIHTRAVMVISGETEEQGNRCVHTQMPSSRRLTYHVAFNHTHTHTQRVGLWVELQVRFQLGGDV